MSSTFENEKNLLMRTIESRGFDQKYNIKKLLMSTRLYSVFLVSDKEHPRANDTVVLLEHTPAKKASAYLLPVTLRESAPKKEQLETVVDAVENFYAETGHEPL